MSLIPINPPCIIREYGCADMEAAGSGDREGVKIWEGKCVGFMVHSWPHVEQTLEIRDKDLNETMNIIPVPGKPIHFGTIRSVELRTAFHTGLLVSWRIVLEAFIDPIYAMISPGLQGHGQWKAFNRSVNYSYNQTRSLNFFAWADGIVRMCYSPSGGSFLAYLYSECSGGMSFSIVNGVVLTGGNWETDLEHQTGNARVSAGRLYRIDIKQTTEIGAPFTFSYDLGIFDDPI